MMNQDPHKQSGYSLLEVMIAVVILSIGLAALGLLQVGNVQNSYNAHNRSLAAAAAANMAERIRTNLQAYENGSFVEAGAGALNNCSGGADVDACTPEQMAEDDLARWQEELTQILPQGAGIVCTDNGAVDDGTPTATACSGTGNTVVKVFWRETANFSTQITTDDVNNEWQAFGLVVYP